MATPGREPWRVSLKLQDWVDVLDTDGRWCLGEVTETRGQFITIHYLGWPIKWVETLPRDSDRLAPQLSRTGHLDGQTGEVEGRARVEFVRTLIVGSTADVYDENMKVWRPAVVEGVNPERTIFTVRFTTDGRSDNIHTKKDYIIKPNSGNVRERIAVPGAPAGAVAGPVAVGQPVANLAAPGAPVAANAVAANAAVVQAARPTPPKPAGKGLGHNLKQWGFADVKDGDTWRIAEVVEVKEDNLQFRFLGWTEARWNVWLHRDSPLVAVPPFSHVKGDTGYKAVSRNYDCMHECMWKRAMVIGLGRAGIAHSQIEGIGHLLQVCFSLQDKLQATNMVPGVDFKKWVQALDVALQNKRQLFNLNKPATPPASSTAAAAAPTTDGVKVEKKEEENPAAAVAAVPETYSFHPALAFAIDTITHIVKGLKEACSDADARADDVNVQNAEKQYMEQARRDFDIVEVPGDGNCLFAATARGEKIVTVLKNTREIDSKTVAALVNNARNVKKEDSLTDSRTLRFRAVQLLNERAPFHGAVKGEVAHAIRDYGESTKGRLNQTNASIFHEMKRQFPNPLDGANSPQALLVYSAVMGSDGIFGTDLEAEALSEDMKCPVWVYYREGASEYNGSPTRVFGAHYRGYPICLAFYRANKHYNLLVPKKPLISSGVASAATFSFQEGGPVAVPSPDQQGSPNEEDKNAGTPPAAPAVAGTAATSHQSSPPPAAAATSGSGRGAALVTAAGGAHAHHTQPDGSQSPPQS